MPDIPTLDDVVKASDRISPYIHQTPVMTSRSLDQLTGRKLYFKCENFQRSGAFKMRGAMNALLGLSQQQREQGVITHSSGNHAGALALACKILGIHCHIVMPEDAPQCKKEAVAACGANITFCAHGMDARFAAIDEILTKQKLNLVHPFDDRDVIAGQGTATLEFLQEIEELDALILPVGGGGLIAGCCTVVKAREPEITVIGVEPEVVDDAKRSFESGVRQPATGAKTIADGLQAGLGQINFDIIRNDVGSIVTVSEQQIAEAFKLIWQRLKIVIEPSSAVPLAALMAGKIPASHQHVGIILTGGNVDSERINNLI